jgi:hypothetical protein
MAMLDRGMWNNPVPVIQLNAGDQEHLSLLSHEAVEQVQEAHEANMIVARILDSATVIPTCELPHDYGRHEVAAAMRACSLAAEAPSYLWPVTYVALKGGDRLAHHCKCRRYRASVRSRTTPAVPA